MKKTIDLLVEGQFVVVEVERGKDSVFGEKVVAKGDLVEEIELSDLLLLLETGEKEEDLGLEGVFPSVPIETGQERVFIRLFQDTPGIKLLGQEFG